MRGLTWLAGVAAVSLLLVTQSAFAAADNACTAAEIARGKTTICHHPPGNPENASTICVGSTGANSPAAHIANHPGDSVGACGPAVCDPQLVECCTAADCADDGDACTTATCTANVCGTASVSGCCNTPADCADDGDACTTATCVANVCGIETAPGPVCCQDFEDHCSTAACCDACPLGSSFGCSASDQCVQHPETSPPSSFCESLT